MCSNISLYRFHFIFDPINAVMVSKRDFFQKILLTTNF